MHLVIKLDIMANKNRYNLSYGHKPIDDKMKRLDSDAWFDHVRKKSIDALARSCERIVMKDCRRGKVRPIKNWNEMVRHDLKALGLTERKLWKFRIKVADFLWLLVFPLVM